MYRAEKLAGQKPVARHRQHDPRLAQHEHHQHGGDAGQSAEGDDRMNPRQPDLTESFGDGGIDIDLLIRNHAGQDRGDGDIKNRA